MSTWYIATTGNDSTGDGSSGNPWATPAKAASVAAVDDTVMVAAGTYTLPATNITVSGINWIGAGWATTIWAGANNNFYWTLHQGGSWTGFTFSSTATVGNGWIFYPGGNQGGTYSWISCLFLNMSGNGNSIIDAQVACTVNLIATLWVNCLCGFSNPTGIVMNLLNNIFYLSPGTAVGALFYGGSYPLNLVNNIFFNATGSGQSFSAYGSLTNVTGGNNDIFNFSSPPSLPGNIAADPLFVSASTGNFNLNINSPCIGTGTMI
jgi:hypothetical protein